MTSRYTSVVTGEAAKPAPTEDPGVEIPVGSSAMAVPPSLGSLYGSGGGVAEGNGVELGAEDPGEAARTPRGGDADAPDSG